MFTAITLRLKSHCVSASVHALNAQQRQTAADLCTKPTDLSHRPACSSNMGSVPNLREDYQYGKVKLKVNNNLL